MVSSVNKTLSYTKSDEEISKIFNEIGLRCHEARALVLFFKGFELTSREVERITDLRQPEVSIALNLLLKRRWIQITRHITENKGRPVNLYLLSITIDEILDELKSEISKDYNSKIESIERVRLLVMESKEME